MSTEASALQISYAGEPVRVDPTRISEDMFVPNLGREDVAHADEQPAEVAADLFELAIKAGAIVTPAGFSLACYADEDSDGGGIILVAFAEGQRRRGVTCGWRDVRNLTRPPGDERADNDPDVVADALELMAAELNTSLAG